MRETSLFTAISSFLVCTACGVDHMRDADVNALADNIDSARLEVSRHQDAILGAGTLTEVPPEVDRHERNMGNVMTMMGTSMDGMMSHCAGAGMTTMHDRMDDVDAEMLSYRDAMLGTVTLTDARNECAIHTQRMEGMLNDMQRSLMAVGCGMMGR